ncbi:hypothetical protein C8Q72DRAFT_478280 [Fomitopsis betulina]|nr:hypothetical protein C8Q72DRAFT_478280 [Fomitopsis betulina]
MPCVAPHRPTRIICGVLSAIYVFSSAFWRSGAGFWPCLRVYLARTSWDACTVTTKSTSFWTPPSLRRVAIVARCSPVDAVLGTFVSSG